jgi:hypothetical protein
LENIYLATRSQLGQDFDAGLDQDSTHVEWSAFLDAAFQHSSANEETIEDDILIFATVSGDHLRSAFMNFHEFVHFENGPDTNSVEIAAGHSWSPMADVPQPIERTTNAEVVLANNA